MKKSWLAKGVWLGRDLLLFGGISILVGWVLFGGTGVLIALAMQQGNYFELWISSGEAGAMALGVFCILGCAIMQMCYQLHFAVSMGAARKNFYFTSLMSFFLVELVLTGLLYLIVWLHQCLYGMLYAQPLENSVLMQLLAQMPQQVLQTLLWTAILGRLLGCLFMRLGVTKSVFLVWGVMLGSMLLNHAAEPYLTAFWGWIAENHMLMGAISVLAAAGLIGVNWLLVRRICIR